MANAQNAAETPPEKTKPKRKAGPGRPTAENAGPIKEAKQNRFFDAINNVAAADWGSRVTLYLYRLEPYTDRSKSGEFLYLMRYAEAVDEQRVMVDFGSGRYRLMLNLRKLGAERGDEADRYDFEICNPAHPPKIPKGEWVDDPRNHKWAWAKPFLLDPTAPAAPVLPAQGNSNGTLIEALGVLNDIQDSTAERMKAAAPATEARPTIDPIDQAVKLVTLLQGGGQTKIMELFDNVLARAEARADKLETALRTQSNAPTAAPIDPLDALDRDALRFERMKKLFGKEEKPEAGGIETAVANIAKSRMSGWMEFLQPAVPEILRAITPLTTAFAHKLMQPPGGPAQHQQQPSGPQAIAPPQQPTDAAAQPQQSADDQQNGNAQNLMRFMYEMGPRMVKHVFENEPGDVFAQWIADGYGAERVQKINGATPDQIVLFYKTTAQWQVLADREEQVKKFWVEFSEWKPEEDEPMPSDGMEVKEEAAG